MKKVLALLLAAVMSLSLIACGAKEKAKDITITFVNGDNVIGTLTVPAGEKVTGYEKFEALEGYVFEGWYKTPTMMASSLCDITTETFTSDRKLFGAFRSLAKREDTRSWYIVGEGASTVLRTSAWAGSSVTAEGKALCQLQPTGKNTNEFSITLDLYKGDMFQLITNWGWDLQKGFGLFKGIDTTMFESGGSLSGENEKANVKVLMDGNYTITITTDPDNANYDEITVVRNGDAAPAEIVEEEPYKVSESTEVVMKGSWVSDWSENIKLERVAGTAAFKGTKELAAGTELYFMIWDNGEDTGIGMNSTAVTDAASKALLEEAYNVKVAAAGTYTFTVDAETLTITVTK